MTFHLHKVQNQAKLDNILLRDACVSKQFFKQEW